jgi:hypothetical protein
MKEDGMETDFRRVLRDMRAEERRLEEELTVLRRSIPGIELMVSRMPPEANAASLKYAQMGTKEATLHLLTESGNSLTAVDVAESLLAGGIRTRATDFYGSVSSTLSNLKSEGLVDRVEDRWKIKPAGDSVPTHSSEMIYLSPAAPESAASTFLGTATSGRLNLPQR